MMRAKDLLRRRLPQVVRDEPHDHTLVPVGVTASPASVASAGALVVDAAARPTSDTTQRIPELNRYVPLSQRSPIEKVGLTVALLAVLVTAGLLWRAGANFTITFLERLTFLERFGIAIAEMGLWKWSIPVAITAIELFFWPRRTGAFKNNLLFFWPNPGDNILKHWCFLLVLLFDIGNTCAGAIETFSGQTLRWETIASIGSTMFALGLSVGILCAIGAERLAKWAFRDLWDMWVPKRSKLNKRAQQWGLVA